MKAKDIQVGQKYLAKVSGKVVPVRVTRLTSRTTGYGSTTRDHDAWDCISCVTGRQVRVLSPQRFRSHVPSQPTAAEWDDRIAAERRFIPGELDETHYDPANCG